MAFSRAQVLFLISCVLLWGVISCSHANGTAFAPPAGGSSQIAAGDRVHIDSQVNDLVAGTWRSIYTVPTNKWLVITDFDTSIEGNGEIAIAELMLEKLTTKRERYFVKRESGYHSESGMTFRPGSQVVFVNRVITSTVMDDIGYSFSGYLLAD
jgi:hypothetical protein